VKISDQAGLLFISKAISSALLFAVGPILTRYMDLDEYGTFLQINLITSFLVAMIPWGIPQAISFFVPRIGTAKCFSFVVRTLTALFVLGCFGGVMVWLGRDLLGRWMNNPQLITLAPYIGGLIVVTILSDTTETIFYAYNRAIVVGVVLPLKAITRLLGVVLPVLLGWGLVGIFEGIIVVGLVESVLLYGYHLLKLREADSVSDAVIVSMPEQLRYALPLGLTMLLIILGSNIDKYVVSSSFTPAQYAVYARGAFELPLIGILPGMLFDLLLPKFSEYLHKGQTREVLRLMRESIRRTALVFYPVCLLSVVLADTFITFLFTDAYAASAPIFRVFLLAMVFQVANFQIIFRATGSNSRYLNIIVLRIIVGLVLTVGLLNVFGALGAALAIVITQAVTTVLSCVLAGRELSEPWLKLVPWSDLGKTLSLSACVAVVILPITWLAVPNWAILLLGGGAFGLLYLLCAFYLKRVSDADREILTRWAALVMRPS
jgi:O-antigen/teichoic acid export membrane protein